MQRRTLVALASVATMALAVPAVAHSDGDTSTAGDTASTDTRTSEATITTTDCVVESTKDISYIAYFDDGMLVDKENVNAPTFDLTTVDGIDEIDQIDVKSGTTVETFEIDCPAEPTGDDTTSDDTTSDDTTSDDTDSDDTETDDTETDDDTPTGDEEADHREKGHKRGDRFDSRGNSEATITLDGCLVQSSKDLSYIAFYDDGTFVDKDENIDEETFDLTTVDGIDEIDEIDVKSGTTVETFEVACTAADSDEQTQDDQKADEHETSDADHHETSDDEETSDDDGTADDEETSDPQETSDERDDDHEADDRDHDDGDETSDDHEDDEESDEDDHDDDSEDRDDDHDDA